MAIIVCYCIFSYIVVSIGLLPLTGQKDFYTDKLAFNFDKSRQLYPYIVVFSPIVLPLLIGVILAIAVSKFIEGDFEKWHGDVSNEEVDRYYKGPTDTVQ